MQGYWNISLGYCGPTDCCLVLHNPELDKWNEYYIESYSWCILSYFWDIPKQEGFIPAKLGRIVWENGKEDMRKEED